MDIENHEIVVTTGFQAGSREICKHYCRVGTCKHESSCRYVHDRSKVAICRSFLRGECGRGLCPLSHSVDPNRLPECGLFLRNLCVDPKCPYLHVNKGSSAGDCEEFRTSWCPLGVECPRRHYIPPTEKRVNEERESSDEEQLAVDEDEVLKRIWSSDPVLKMYLLFWVEAQQSGSSSLPARRLLISGTTVGDSSDLSPTFVVALMLCREQFGSSGSPLVCSGFCTGSLIAPNVALSAGHCLFDIMTGRRTVSLELLYVLVGSTDASGTPSSGGGRLVKVDRVVNGGYGMSNGSESPDVFPYDDDLSLLFLADCVAEEARARFVKIGLKDHLYSSGSCPRVRTYGFGRHESVPVELFVADGRLRFMDTTVHGFEACRSAAYEKPQPGDSAGVMSVEKFFCAGGDEIKNICSGDSGGPVVLRTERGEVVQVGISSFNKSPFCGNSPDYSVRLGSYVQWIEHMLREQDECPGWTLDNVFEQRWEEDIDETGIEVFVRSASGLDMFEVLTPVGSLCTTDEWRCRTSGECVKKWDLCNRQADCADGTDETSTFCDPWTAEEELRFGKLVEAAFAKVVERGGSTGTSAWTSLGWMDEVPSLLDEGESETGVSEGLTNEPEAAGASTGAPPFHVVNKLAQQLSLSKCANAQRASKEVLLVATNLTSPSNCVSELHTVDAFIQASKRDGGERNDSWINATVLGAAGVCTVLENCVKSILGNEDLRFEKWVREGLACGSLRVLPEDAVKPLTLCGGLNGFLTLNASRESYANNFTQLHPTAHSCGKFGGVLPTNPEKHKTDIPDNAMLPPTTTTSTKSSSTLTVFSKTIAYIGLILSVYFN